MLIFCMWFICLDVWFFACDLNVIYMFRCLHVYVVDMGFRVYVYFALQVFDEMFEWVFHWLFNFLGCRFETMTDLFSVSIRFNGGNPQMFKVRYINVTFNGLKDQPDEINQRLNPRDTRRVDIHLIWMSNVGRRENNVQSTRIKERRQREEHVLDFLAAQHVLVDRYVWHVAEINWRYSQQFDSARRSWLGSIHPSRCTFQLQQLSYLWSWIRSNLLNNSSQAFTRKFYV